MPSHAAQERQALVQALIEAGPQAPTLCAGWTAWDLAAHLAVRERRPDAAGGLLLPRLAGYTERVRAGYAQKPFEDLVELVRTGPPRWSVFAIPGVDAAVNLAEHFVHCEDVRRGGDSWQARDLDEGLQDALWTVLSRMSRLLLRGSADPVRLLRPDGAEIGHGPAGRPVRLAGEAGELMLYLYGRTGVAQVEITGPEEAVARFRALRLQV
jgi:uncharacterized protein (TIGR03085 family)